MDIVSRLKTFITYVSVPVTQFADNCGIARPTLSQLLNGRNKKVSDELISKIHHAYPDLSVLWLMFGEGEMLHNPAEAKHKATEASIFDFEEQSAIETEEKDTPQIDFNNSYTDAEHEESPAVRSQYADVTSFSPSSPSAPEPNTTSMAPKVETLAYASDSRKKIVNIIVYYSDNSFEAFVPNTHK